MIEQIPLVGRQPEIVRLRSVLDDAADGSARLVFIEGEPGIGKSRLMAELAIEASARGFSLVGGRAEELQRERPFGAISDALDIDVTTERALSDQTEDAFTSMPGARHRVVDAIVERVAMLTENHPALLALDDVQWADPSTILAVGALLRGLPMARLVVALASRPVPRPVELSRLVDGLHGAVTSVRLGPLASDEVVELSAALTGHPIGDGLARQAGIAGGNPFYLAELIAALAEDGIIVVVDGNADVAQAALPASLRSTIVRRLGFLPPDTLELLSWASIIGSAFSARDLAVAAAIRLADVLRTLEPAIRAEMLVGDGGRLAFRHDLVREAIYDDIPAAIRAGMHFTTAERRLAAGSRAVEVAAHLDRGVVGRDPQAAETMRRAAAEVAAGSPPSAVALLQRALAMTEPGDAVRDQIGFDLVRALLWSGRWDESAQLAGEVLERSPASTQTAVLRYSIARAHAYRGRMEEAIAEVERAVQSPHATAHERARLLADLSLRLPLIGDLDGGEQAGQQALELAGDSDRLATRTAWSGLGLIDALRGNTDRGVQRARLALPFSEESANEAVELVQPTFFLAITLIEADGLAEASELLERLRERVDRTGMAWASGLVGVLLSELRYLTGRWTEAVVEAETAIQLCAESGTHVWSLRALSVVAAVAARRGETDRAAAWHAEGTRLVSAIGRAHLGFDRWLLAGVTVAESAGDESLVHTRLEDAWLDAQRRSWVISRRAIGPRLVRSALARGDNGLGHTVAVGVAEAALVGGAPGSMRAAAEHCRGLDDGDAGAVGSAVSGYAAAGREVSRASALEDLAAVAAVGGDAKTGRRALDEAAMLYAEFGASFDLLRVEQQLRRLGVRRGARGGRSRPTAGWDSLTRSELQVVQLAAEGLTNREVAERLFVSPRTVATHLGHIFAKLGLGSRVELARAAARHQLGSDEGQPDRTAGSTPMD